MSSHDNASDKAYERSGNPQSNPHLYADIYQGYDGHPALSTANRATSGGGENAQYLDFTNPYNSSNGSQNDSIYGSHKFAEDHPWRETVLDGAKSLDQEVKKDGGHLDGQYQPLMKEINSVRAEEERDAAGNGGHITAKEKAQLLSEEGDIRKEIGRDHKKGGHHHGHKPGDPTNPGGPTNPGDPTNPGTNPIEPPPPITNPVEPTPPGTTPPITDGKFLLGTAVIPGDVGASNENQAINNFSKDVGVQQQEQMFYTNQNVPGRSSVDVAGMIKDAQQGITPVLSLRTLDYKSVTNGSDDAYLKQVAADMKAVQAAGKAAGYSGDVILRPNWEMDGSARQAYGTPAEFVSSWQHMHDVISSQGVTNVKWAFTPDSQSYDSKVPGWSSPVSQYYPGNNYVDYIGADGYSGLGGAAYKTPDQIFSSGVAFAQQHGKQFYIGETGVANTGIDPSTGKAYNVEYMQQMAAYIKANPDIAGMSWFSEGSNNILNNPAEQAAFTQMEKDLGGQSA
jgi:hypothetical protein